MSHTLKHHSVCRPPQQPAHAGAGTPAKQGTDREHSRGGQSWAQSHNATSEGGEMSPNGQRLAQRVAAEERHLGDINLRAAEHLDVRHFTDSVGAI